MKDEAFKLAQALSSARQTRFIQAFNIEGSNDEITVIAIRTSPDKTRKITEAVKAIGYPGGEPCPCCNGSGVIG